MCSSIDNQHIYSAEARLEYITYVVASKLDLLNPSLGATVISSRSALFFSSLSSSVQPFPLPFSSLITPALTSRIKANASSPPSLAAGNVLRLASDNDDLPDAEADDREEDVVNVDVAGDGGSAGGEGEGGRGYSVADRRDLTLVVELDGGSAGGDAKANLGIEGPDVDAAIE